MALLTKIKGQLRANPPRGWHEQKDAELVCPHRDLSVCKACVENTPEVFEVYGVHYWIPNPSDRAQLAAGVLPKGGR